MKPSPPPGPPKLEKMDARKSMLECERKELFIKWLMAISKSNGNVAKAGESFAPPASRAWANKLVGKLGLAEYARQLRVKMVGQSRGTPKRVSQGK